MIINHPKNQVIYLSFSTVVKGIPVFGIPVHRHDRHRPAPTKFGLAGGRVGGAQALAEGGEGQHRAGPPAYSLQNHVWSAMPNTTSEFILIFDDDICTSSKSSSAGRLVNRRSLRCARTTRGTSSRSPSTRTAPPSCRPRRSCGRSYFLQKKGVGFWPILWQVDSVSIAFCGT